MVTKIIKFIKLIEEHKISEKRIVKLKITSNLVTSSKIAL